MYLCCMYSSFICHLVVKWVESTMCSLYITRCDGNLSMKHHVLVCRAIWSRGQNASRPAEWKEWTLSSCSTTLLRNEGWVSSCRIWCHTSVDLESLTQVTWPLRLRRLSKDQLSVWFRAVCDSDTGQIRKRLLQCALCCSRRHKTNILGSFKEEKIPNPVNKE